MGLSVGLDIAMRALAAQQAAVDTVSNNIANATTRGYSRQRVQMVQVLGANSYMGAGGVGGPSGGGVELLPTQRIRDLFVDYQVRTAQQDLGRYSAQASSLQRVELVLNEPGDNGLRAMLSKFWNSWRDLANNPESSATRTAVVQAGSSLAVTARRIHDSVALLRDEANARIAGGITQLNSLATRVADLNEQIARLNVSGNDASDLRDQRDMALDELSGLANAQFQEREDGNVDIYIGGRNLVSGNTVYAVQGVANVLNNGYLDVEFADGSPVNIAGGELAGLLQQRDVDLNARLADLNALIGQVITDVNTAHLAGFGADGVGNRAFFTGTDASTVDVNAVVAGNPAAVAASSTLAGVPGNGAGASAISDLQYAKNLGGGTITYDEYWSNFVTGLGSAIAETNLRVGSQEAVVQHLEELRQSTSGVNLDEEMVNLMGHQRAYEAAARLVTVANDMLDVLLRMT